MFRSCCCLHSMLLQTFSALRLGACKVRKDSRIGGPCATSQVGFPIMIKATAGGGGRGMRLAMKESEFMTLMRQASQEAEAAFGNGAVYLERYVQNPRHIEFQVPIAQPLHSR